MQRVLLVVRTTAPARSALAVDEDLARGRRKDGTGSGDTVLGAAAGAALVHGPGCIAHYKIDPLERPVELGVTVPLRRGYQFRGAAAATSTGVGR
jgi:hypothetical protein